MAARSVWKGFIRFGLVTLPVKAYTATASGGGGVALNQLHKDCGMRIKYQKTCPEHGEVKGGEIVSGYQYAPDQYVVIDPDDLERLRSEKDKSVNIVAFIKPTAIDPAQYSGRTLYLVPDGPVGFKPYALLLRTMLEQENYAFAQVVFSAKDQVVLLRPIGGLLAMTFLSFASEVRPPSEFAGEVPKADASAQELKMAHMLVETMVDDDFDFTQYKDTYNERLLQLVESKVAGKQIVTPPAEEPQQVPDLVEALKRSLATAKPTQKKKPAKLAAPSKPAAAAKRRKSS
jgi:DNA end-binding protein Ku